MKKILIICLVICLAIPISFPMAVSATTVPINITVSRIGYSTSYLKPGIDNAVNVTGISVDGVPYMKVADISSKLGASITYYSDNVSMILNGQETRAFYNSTYFETCCTYTGVYLTPTTTKDYQFFGYGYESFATACYDSGYWYVALKVLNSLGVLMVYTESSTQYEVFDFRANNPSVSDPNNYVVGGTWIDSGYCYELNGTFPGYASWSAMSTHKLARNFTIGEMRDKSTSSSNPAYYSQMKIAAELLSAAQQVRYVHNYNSSMTISGAFRSWYYNMLIGGATRSTHLRGRAFDAPLDALYTKVYNEFKGTYSTPRPIDSAAFSIDFWRRRVSTPIGDEIEPMENETDKWLHMQVDPSVENGIAPFAP